MTLQAGSSYPVVFDIEYPDGPQNRLKAVFRIILAIPILILVSTITGGAQSGSLIFGPALMIIFRQKYPRWWFDFNVELARFNARIGVYLALLREEYPATDDHQAITLDFEYPDVERDLNRWMPIVKWILAIPHYVLLILLGIVAILAIVAAWFAILFTGNYPRGLFDFVVGVGRWSYRVQAYAFLLTTDKYPPFSLK
ncbi:MAG: DUF4389 domain-containing protein [Bacteroidetes bacterium]|nr:DUF4389 domain-containing protein [Bacteroidota bacterium]